MACPRIEAPRKLEKFFKSIDLKNYGWKEENELLIPTRGLQRKQLNILETGINVLCTK